MSVKALVVYGLGIGCHAETVKAYQLAGAEAELIHFNDLAKKKTKINDDVQIINFSGGFLHGDILGSAMCATNELANKFELIDFLWDFSEKGGVLYGQCNGFQLLVKSGLLPAFGNDYKQQTVSLVHNECGYYRVAHVPHKVVSPHFAFSGIDDLFYLWCRHGEGKIEFGSSTSSYSPEQITEHKAKIAKHVLLSYVDPSTGKITEEFPHNPNGSEQGIAGLSSSNQRIFGHMAHPEVSVLDHTDPEWFKKKELAKRAANADRAQPVGLKIFKNIVSELS